MAETLKKLLDDVAACTICADHLPLGPRPVVRITETARVLIIGQAPGAKVHESGIPWNDRSGDRLRQWLDVDRDFFYDSRKINIMPMGFCYPGRNPKGGDMPPRPECAPHWHERLRSQMKGVELTLLVGSHAQSRYLEKRARKTMTETVRAWREYGPDIVPTPHPSWRTTAWLKKNPWFDEEVIPHIRNRFADLFQVNDVRKQTD